MTGIMCVHGYIICVLISFILWANSERITYFNTVSDHEIKVEIFLDWKVASRKIATESVTTLKDKNVLNIVVMIPIGVFAVPVLGSGDDFSKQGWVVTRALRDNPELVANQTKIK